jgi:hypothetical protein
LASIVKESDVTRILKYKDKHNSFKMHERERPMLHDNNAFKNRPHSLSKSSNIIIKSSLNVNLNNIGNASKCEKVDLKSLLKTTLTKPFYHKNFSEIPD